MFELKITENTSGGRLDKTVLKYLNQAPKGFVYKMLRKKNIVLNGRKAMGPEILSPGDIVTLYLADDTIKKFRKNENREKEQPGRKNYHAGLSSLIIYEDENIIAVNKPSGILSQKSSTGQYSLNDMIVEYIGRDELFTPGISNRLDRNTSGIILAGKNPQSVRLINEAIKNRYLQKMYLVISEGSFPEDMVLDGYLSKKKSVNISEITEHDPGGSSYVKAAFHVITATDVCSLLSVDLITGRSHQIRSQLSAAGHPVIGDIKYGNSEINQLFCRKYSVRSQLLHGYKVKFNNMGGALEYLNSKVITARVPDEFRRTAKGEGLCLPGDHADFGDLSLSS